MRAINLTFRDTATNTEFVAPVTPASFEVGSGIRIELVNIHTLGDVIFGGHPTLDSIKVDLLLPAQAYPFAIGTPAPYTHVKTFKTWCSNRTVIRYIISETDINIPVLIESVRYGESDGTGDVYMSLTMREYKEISVVQTQLAEKTGNLDRAMEESPPSSAQAYVIVSGDTLSAICRKFYGDAMLYPQLAAYNNIKNPHLIYPGNTLQIPDKSLLLGVS